MDAAPAPSIDGLTARPTDEPAVCAIAVTYHPDADLPSRLSGVLRQARRAIIVDNGSNEAELQALRDFARHPRVTLVANGANLGVARALNIGIELAISDGFAWVLLLDQDSTVDEDMVRSLLAVHAAFPERQRLAVVGSGFREADPAIPDANAAVPMDGWEDAETVITSGSLLALKTHAAIGPFRDEFFIDHVDTEYCFRARAKGYRVIRTKKSLMSHSIGAISRHSILGIKKWTFNHSAERRYYFTRNEAVLLREYGHYRFGMWALKSLGRCVRLCKRIVLYERRKAAKVAAVAQGWWDGVRGHMGPRPHR